jgi:hypothetical protein
MGPAPILCLDRARGVEESGLVYTESQVTCSRWSEETVQSGRREGHRQLIKGDAVYLMVVLLGFYCYCKR